MKQFRQVSMVFLFLGLGFWLHLVVGILRGDHGGAVARNLIDCLPSSKVQLKVAVTGQQSPGQLANTAAGDLEEQLVLAQKIWKGNERKRDRIFGKAGGRLKGLRMPSGMNERQKAKWHPSAYLLEYYRPTYPCFEEERLGIWTSDGAWVCRPNLLTPQAVVYTFGSSDKLRSFETELYRRRQPEVHLFHPTLPSEVREKLQTREEFHFHPVGIGDRDVGPVKTLQSIMRDLAHAYVDVLKIDCEGCEYAVMKQILGEEVVPVGQILLSVYRVMDPRRLRGLLALLEKGGFRMFHMEQDWRRMNVLQLAYIHESLCEPSAEKKTRKKKGEPLSGVL